jgi:DNA-binding PadR family transcriptional regulator
MRGSRFEGPWGGHGEHGRGHERGHRPGGGPGGPGRGFGGPGFPGFDLPGFFEGRGPRGFGRGGGRRPRGDVRAAVLVLLAEGPSNGYRIIGEVTRRSDGEWKPSPGSVYPTLQQLQDEGLVTADPADPKQFTLTEEGRRVVEAEHADVPPPWETLDGGDGREGRDRSHQLRKQIASIAMTYQQIAVAGRPGDLERAGDVLEEARRKLLGILAEDLRGTPGA